MDGIARRLLDLIRLEPGILQRQLQTFSNLSRTGAQHHIDTLDRQGWIRLVKTDNIHCYPKDHRLAQLDWFHSRHRRIIQFMHIRKKSTRADLRKDLDLRRDHTIEDLDKLQHRGYLELGRNGQVQATERLHRLCRDPYNPHWVIGDTSTTS